MSISEPQPRLAVHSLEDLIGLVPYLIGFHPEASLVVIVLEAGRVEVTARIDLAAVGSPAARADLISRLFERYPGAGGWFLAYTDDDHLAWAVLEGCAELLGPDRLQRVLQVGSARWRADAADGPSGELTGEVPSVAAEAALLGLPARSSRRDLAALIRGPERTAEAELLERFGFVARELQRLDSRGRRRLLRRLLTADLPGVDDCVRLALLVQPPEGQLRVLRGLSSENAEAQLALWCRVLAHTVRTHQPAVLGLAAMAAWQNGDGALQMVCLERLDRLDPLAPIGALLDLLNVEVVPPYAWPDLREPLLAMVAGQLRAAGRPATRPGR